MIYFHVVVHHFLVCVYWTWGETRWDSSVNHKDFVHDKQVAVAVAVAEGCELGL